jgi:hypothetical protein
MQSAAILRFVPATAEPGNAAVPVDRFTLDGDAGLEEHLRKTCEQVRAGVEALIPADRLDGILLGGGYGRGEGGVLRLPDGDRPYNDLEFYVLLRGNTVLNEWRHRAALDRLAHALSGPAGVEVEFKVISLADLQRNPVSMFSYDLVRGHHRVCGPADLLAGCAHHQRAEDIPLAEATRLLLNRCTGLLLARQRLARPSFDADDADFVKRNLAKAGLALGDAVLCAVGQYHGSCRERTRRLAGPGIGESHSWLDSVRREHVAGTEFKLHPCRSQQTAAELEKEWGRISQLACRVWLWLESRRMGIHFGSPINYAWHAGSLCQGAPLWRNWLVNVRRLGVRGAVGRRAFRYPRERLFRAMPVLLWQPVLLVNPRVLRRLQRELQTSATDETGLLAAYLRLWSFFR